MKEQIERKHSPERDMFMNVFTKHVYTNKTAKANKPLHWRLVNAGLELADSSQYNPFVFLFFLFDLCRGHSIVDTSFILSLLGTLDAAGVNRVRHRLYRLLLYCTYYSVFWIVPLLLNVPMNGLTCDVCGYWLIVTQTLKERKCRAEHATETKTRI